MRRVGSAKDVVHKGQEVWVKIVSTIGKLTLSMRDVDQNTGKDLLPSQAINPGSSNPGPAGGQGLRGLSGITVKDDDKGNLPRRRPGKRLTSPERWEITQLIKSGVLDVTEYPTFDEEEGVTHAQGFAANFTNVIFASMVKCARAVHAGCCSSCSASICLAIAFLMSFSHYC